MSAEDEDNPEVVAAYDPKECVVTAANVVEKAKSCNLRF